MLNVFLQIAVCLISFTTGITLAFPSVLIPAILAPDGDIKVRPDQASWIDTYLGLGALVGFTFIPTIFEIFGRKMANVVTNLFILIGSFMLYTASDVYSLALARLTQGLAIGGTFTSEMALCECISPKRRGYFIVFHIVSLALGSLTSHTLRIVLNWRSIALVAGSGSLISLIIFIISAESPSFLAMRGQFDKCAKTFKWYRGESLNNKKDLKELVSVQTERLRMKEKDKDNTVYKQLKGMLMTKEFQTSFVIVTLVTLCLDSCGIHILIAYITQILPELTYCTTSPKYMPVATDLILIFALAMSTVLVKYFKRRTLLFRFGFCSVFLMFMVSFSIILRSKLNLSQELKWLTPTVIFLHTIITCIGLVPVTFALSAEVFSLDQRGLGSFMSGVSFLIFLKVVMKLTPLMLDKTGVEGTYSILGCFLFICLVLLYIILPETKGKTLQQIEDEIKGVVRNNSEIDLLKYSEVMLLKHSKTSNC